MEFCDISINSRSIIYELLACAVPVLVICDRSGRGQLDGSGAQVVAAILLVETRRSKYEHKRDDSG